MKYFLLFIAIWFCTDKPTTCNHQSKTILLKMANKNQDCGGEFNSLSASVLSDLSSASSASACFTAAAALLRFDSSRVRGCIGRNPHKPAMKKKNSRNQKIIRPSMHIYNDG